MRVRQYAYFGLSSSTLDPGQLSERVGLVADEALPRGAKGVGPPPRPRHHLWKVTSGLSDERPLDEHLAALLARLSEAEEPIHDLLSSDEAQGAIQVVRRFESGSEDRSIADHGRSVGALERLRGQHPLIGFHLDATLLAFAVRVGVGLDFDEYGDEDD